jgi:PAS domain S-box-containing protein
MDANLRPSGIEGLGDMSWGTHFCLFYETKEDLLDFFIPFLEAGLEHEEFCLCVASVPLIAEEAERVMRQAFPDFERYVAEGQLEITPHTDWYLKDGRFDEQYALRSWIYKLDKALAKGFSGLRFAANFLLDKPDWESFVRFEAKLEDRLHDLRIKGLCAYDLNRYSAANMLDVIRHHQFTLARRDGTWEPLEGAQLKRAHEEVLKLNNELEQRVAERTAELAAANAQLRRGITERKQVERSLQETNSKLQLILNNSPLPIVGEDANARVTAWNKAAERLFGWTEQEVLGQRCPAVPSEETYEYLKMVRQVMQGATYLGLVRYRQKKSGSLLNCSISVAPQRNERAEPIGVTFIVEDITERKQAEAELRQNKEILQTVFDNVPAMITMVDKDGRFILTNRDFENRLGWRPGEMSEQNLDMLAELYPDSQDREAMLDFAERADGRWEDFRTRAKDGRMIDTSWAIVRLSDGSIIGVGKDNTERKRAEEALRKSERVLREAEALGHTGSWEQDLVTGEIFNTEENLQLFFGDDRSKGANLEDYAQVVHPDDREYVLQRRAELLDEEGPGDIEYRVVWSDGSIHWIFGRATVVRDELGQVIRVYGTNVDITERKRAEEALRESEKLLQLVLATLPVGVAVTDPADNIIVANPASKRIWGDVIISGSERRERSIGFWHDSGKRIAPEEWASLRALSKGETSLNELIDIETFDGVHKIIRNSSAPIRNSEGIIVGAVFVNEDVTERKRAEEETKHQAARAETLARIAARLNKQLDLEAVIHAVCQEAVDTFKVSQAVISLYDKKRDLLDYAGGVNIPPQYGAKIESVSRAQFEEFVRTMGPILVVPDIQALPNVPSAEFTFELNVRTVVTADMRRDQELIGVLVLGVNGQVREFDRDELTLLKAISDQAAQAIANAQLLKTANEQREELRNLSTRLVQVQEAERRAITTELHDRVGQNLTGLSIAIQNMKASLSNQSQETVAAEINDAQTLLEDTTRHIRDIMAELYLPELEDHGLAAALETYADRVASRANLDLVVDLPETPLRLSSDVRVALFRAAQEAISNVLKHADATQLEISLQRENGRVRLRVEDNGQGFEPSPESPKETPSWGLKIMRERIESIGGKVQIESKPGEGTRVTFEIERSS